MNFPEAILSAFRNYANFSGRAARSEYWYWALFCSLGNILTKSMTNVALDGPHPSHPLNLLFLLVILLPTYAVVVRRLHDINRSGWWILIELTIIGIIYPMLFWKCTKGTEGENRFGPDPLA